MTIAVDNWFLKKVSDIEVSAIKHVRYREVPLYFDTLQAPGRRFTPWYLEEKAVLEEALAWLLKNCDNSARVTLICTDSQNLYAALLGQNFQHLAKSTKSWLKLNQLSIFCEYRETKP